MTALLLLISALGAGSTPLGDVAIPRAEQAIRLRIEAVGEWSPETKWRAFLQRFVEHFDRNGDLSLDATEAARAIPLPGSDGETIRLDVQAADVDGDRSASLDEVFRFYRDAGFSPLAAFVLPPAPELAAASETLFDALDRDGDGTLSRAELDDATQSLRQLDENEDEIVRQEEALLRSTATFASTALSRTAIPLAAAVGDADAVARIAQIDGQVVAEIASDSESNVKLVVGIGRQSASLTAQLAASKEFYLALFSGKADGKDSVALAELQGDASLAAIAQMAVAADRDEDRALTEDELSSFLDLVAAGVACRTFVTIEDRGAGLFDLLDTNDDRAVDSAELESAAELAPLHKAELPRRYSVFVNAESGAKSFGPVPIPEVRSHKSASPKTGHIGPRWFVSMDRTGDGVVSEMEFRGTPVRFREIDRDSDGRIDLHEAELAGT